MLEELYVARRYGYYEGHSSNYAYVETYRFYKFSDRETARNFIEESSKWEDGEGGGIASYEIYTRKELEGHLESGDIYVYEGLDFDAIEDCSDFKPEDMY